MPEQDLTPELRRLVRSSSIAAATSSTCPDRGAQRGPRKHPLDRACRRGERATDLIRAQLACLGTDSWLSLSCSAVAARYRRRRLPGTYGRNPDLLTQLQRLGAHRAASAADLAARSEYVIVLLQFSTETDFDLDRAGSRPGCTVRPSSLGAISTPDDLRNLAGELAEKTAGLLRLVDAPLSEPQQPPSAANCPLWSAPHQASIGTHYPYWSQGTCVRLGGVGSAQIANACEKYVMAATAMALSEAAVIAERAGLDLTRVLQSWEALP